MDVVSVGAGLRCDCDIVGAAAAPFICIAGGVVVSPLGVSTGGGLVAGPTVALRSLGSNLSLSNLGNCSWGGGEAGVGLLGVVAPLSDEIHSPSLSSSSSEPLPSREASVKPALCLPFPLVVPTAPVADV